jgi:RNA polymerase sigma factor (sigma-70 family)
MVSDGTVTDWIIRLKAGQPEAPQRLWERYFQRLVSLARTMLRDAPRAAADEEDVALDAFECFCRAAKSGRYPQLNDRGNLWKLLVLLTGHKALDWVRHERRHKRGRPLTESEHLELIVDREPTPEFALEVADECRRLLASLEDDDLKQVALRKMEGYTTEEIAAQMRYTSRSIERKLQLIRRIWANEAMELNVL